MNSASFKDDDNKIWIIKIDYKIVKLINAMYNFNLLQETEGLIKAINNDNLILINIVIECCRKQFDNRGLDEDDFLELIYGDIAGDMQEAFYESLANFTQSPSGAEVIRKSIKKAKEINLKQKESVQNGTTSKMIDKELSRLFRDI